MNVLILLEAMGSRGKFSSDRGATGGVALENREYSCIGKIGKIKIIQCDKYSNNPAPTYSNTANTVYFSYHKKKKKIERIYYYKNHKLYKSIDFKENETPHAHYWYKTNVGRKKHDKHNIHDLNDRDKRLLKLAQQFNDGRK